MITRLSKLQNVMKNIKRIVTKFINKTFWYNNTY